MPPNPEKLAEILAAILLKKSLKIAVAESCTGGTLSASLTAISGASAYFDSGYITYSNEAKIRTLKVQKSTIKTFGSVSEQVAKQMAQGVITLTKTDLAIAISGIAGPSGGSPEKPVGTVCFAFYYNNKTTTTTQYFQGTRPQIITQSTTFALETLIKALNNKII